MLKTLSFKFVLLQACQELKNIFPQSYYLDARLLLQFSCQKTHEQLLMDYDKEITSTSKELFYALLARRMLGEPIAYIIGQKEFYGHKFHVNKHVLIPRPETELFIDYIGKNFHHEAKLKILDIGTGSGCILISLLKIFKKSCGIAVDISSKALRIAKDNAISHCVNARINFIQSDWFANVPMDEKMDLIVSNPPYIDKENDQYQENVMKYEPHIALFTQEFPLSSYEMIFVDGRKILKEKGLLIVEHGFDQACKIKNIALKYNFVYNETICDLYGLQRISVFK